MMETKSLFQMEGRECCGATFATFDAYRYLLEYLLKPTIDVIVILRRVRHPWFHFRLVEVVLVVRWREGKTA
jgi:hypothetical protein